MTTEPQSPGSGRPHEFYPSIVHGEICICGYAQEHEIHAKDRAAEQSDIPAELKELLDQVYTPEGVVIWWTGKHRLLGCSAQEAWPTRRAEVMQVAMMLLDGAFS